jgi:preprotein translocase subunit SecF
MEQEHHETHKKHWHDKYYKILLVIPIAVLLFCFIYMGAFYAEHQSFIRKDISLTGGTSITVYEKVDIVKLEQDLLDKLPDLATREIYDLITREQKAVIIQTTADGGVAKEALENYFGYELTEENSSFEFTGSALSESFFKQILIAILIAFVFMAIVVFVIFRTPVPSSAVIISALADILMTLTLVNLLGIKLSTAGIVALLILIGYSVDTDIMLTTRLLKRRETSLNSRLYGAFKTGLTMTLTSLLAFVFVLLIIRSFSDVLTQIFTILVIGLGFDLFNTWITNASILKWYAKHKEKKKHEA